MKATKPYQFGGQEITLHELDVVQAMSVIRRARDLDDPTDLDLGNAFEFMPEFVLDEILGQPLAELLKPGISHTELEQLYKEALELNPFLARAMKNMARMIQASQMMLDGSETQLLDLLKEVTSESGSTDLPPFSQQ